MSCAPSLVETVLMSEGGAQRHADRQELERCHRQRGLAQVLHGERIIEDALGAGDAAALVTGAVGAALDEGSCPGWALAALCHERDDAADGVGPVEAALEAAPHLQSGEILGLKLAEIEGAVWR